MTPVFLFATEAAEHGGEASGHHSPLFLLMLCIVLTVGLLGNYVEKFGQPAVIGQIMGGIGLSAVLYYTQWQPLQDMLTNEFVIDFAEIGAVMLLFAVGLENHKADLLKVGTRGLGVASIGVVLPFVLGAYVMGPVLFPDESGEALLFLGAALVATSVGITIVVFKSIGLASTSDVYRTVLSAAVADDVGGLVILAVVSEIASGGNVTALSVAWIVFKAVGFLVVALLVGDRLARMLSRLISGLNSELGSKVIFAVVFAVGGAYLGSLFGLAPIIGAFAAGLVLDKATFEGFTPHEEHKIIERLHEIDVQLQAHFPEVYTDIALDCDHDSNTGIVRELADRIDHDHEHEHVEIIMNRLMLLFVPVFFVFVGFQVNFGSLLNLGLYPKALALTVMAILTKLAAGIVMPAGKRLVTGASMVARGEVGLIFASTGKALGALSDELFSTILIVVVLTTIIAPFMIKLTAKGVSTDDVSSGDQPVALRM